MERKLASVQRIDKLTPIPNADRIETASVLGWEVVVGKGEFAVGDLAIYFEIDSFLPLSNAAFSNLEDRASTFNSVRGVRLKTIKLRKQVSQGLLIPIEKFKELKLINLEIGQDVTELLGVVKWESQEESTSNNGSFGGRSSSSFPAFIPKTDQERIQNIAHKVVANIDKEFEVSIKLDGSSCTMYSVSSINRFYKEALAIKNGNQPKVGWFTKIVQYFKDFFSEEIKDELVYGLASRNVSLSTEGSSNFHTVFNQHKEILKHSYNYAFQGELIAPNIQGNYEKVDEPQFVVFNVFCLNTGQYLSPGAAEKVCNITGFKYVPYIFKGKLTDFLAAHSYLFDEYNTENVTKALLEIAEGPGMNKGVKREGLVFKALDEKFSFKAISNSYLLKKG